MSTKHEPKLDMDSKPRKIKFKEASIVAAKKTKELPKLTWSKFDGKKFFGGLGILGAGVALEMFAPWSHAVSGYIIDTGLGVTLIGAGHKMIKNKKTVKTLLRKLIKKK